MSTHEVIYGENASELRDVIAALQYSPHGRDQLQISSHNLAGPKVQPLIRALMRAEAEVLLDKADAGTENQYPQAGIQRSGEAFARVFRAAGFTVTKRQ